MTTIDEKRARGEKITSSDVFRAVAARDLTPEEGADILLESDRLERERDRRLLGVAFITSCVVFSLAVALLVGTLRGCSPRPDPIDLGIDAGPGEVQIAERLDADIQRVNERLAELDRQYAEDIAAFDEQQRARYEALANEDLDTVVRFLENWHRSRTRER